MKRYNFYILIVGLIFLASCYSYGPIHKPYGYNKKTKEYKQYYINQTFEDAKATLPEAEIQLVEDSIKILFPEHILYKLKEVEPSSVYQSSLEKLTVLLQHHAETDMLVIGHCDNTGSSRFNKKLSANRAYFIKKYLVQLGIS